MTDFFSEDPAQDLAGLRVLILEPDPSMRRLLEFVLEREKCEVSSAAGPESGIEESIDFVLSNHRYLSVVDIYPDSKHLFMTSLPIAQKTPRLYEVIFKPFQLAELLRRMASMVRGSRVQPERLERGSKIGLRGGEETHQAGQNSGHHQQPAQ